MNSRSRVNVLRVCLVTARWRNIEAAAVELTLDDLRDIDDAASKISVQGSRYPEKLEQMTGLRDQVPSLPAP